MGNLNLLWTFQPTSLKPWKEEQTLKRRSSSRVRLGNVIMSIGKKTGVLIDSIRSPLQLHTGLQVSQKLPVLKEKKYIFL